MKDPGFGHNYPIIVPSWYDHICCSDNVLIMMIMIKMQQWRICPWSPTTLGPRWPAPERIRSSLPRTGPTRASTLPIRSCRYTTYSSDNLALRWFKRPLISIKGLWLWKGEAILGNLDPSFNPKSIWVKYSLKLNKGICYDYGSTKQWYLCYYCVKMGTFH